jgi:hypothetical protein
MRRFLIGLAIFVLIAGLAVGAAFGVNALIRNQVSTVSTTSNNDGSIERGPGMMHQNPDGGFFGRHDGRGMMGRGVWDRGDNNDLQYR